ncbi:MAG: type II toxin-antitoxin system RelE/ParE family toxin [Roseiarcus sp.]|jgi:mRNA interferase RelE/StbE
MSKLLWGLAVGPVAASFLNGMHPGKARAQIVKKYRTLQIDPHPAGCKKLVDMKHSDEPVWRIRSGDYRILYVVREQEVVVIDIDHRKDVYR